MIIYSHRKSMGPLHGTMAESENSKYFIYKFKRIADLKKAFALDREIKNFKLLKAKNELI